MPQVPQYEQRATPQVQTGVRIQSQTPRATALDSLRDVANVGIDIALQEKRKADVTASFEADQALAQFETETFHSETGVYAKKGRDVLGLQQSTFEAWDQRVSEISGTLKNDDQRAAFARLAANRRTSQERSLARHTIKESDKYYQDTAEAYIQTAAQSAANNFTDPDRVADEIQKARDAVVLAFDGASAETIKAAEDKAVAGVHSAVIQRMAEDSPSGAQAYLEGIADQLPAEVSQQLRNGLETGVAQEKGRDEADRIWGKYGNNKADILKAIGEIEDEGLRRFASSDLKARLAQAKAAEQEHIEGLENKAWQTALTGASLASMDSKLVNGLLQHSPKTLRDIQLYHEREQGPSKATIAQTYGELSEMSDEDLAKVNPNSLIPRLGTGAEHKYWAKEIKEARAGNKTNISQLNEQFDVATHAYPAFKRPTKGRSKGKLKPEQEQALGTIKQSIIRDIEQAEREGKRLDYDGRQSIISRHLFEHWRQTTTMERDEGLFAIGQDTPISDMTFEDLAADNIELDPSVVPPDQLEYAKEALRSMSIKDSDENATRYFLARLTTSSLGTQGRQKADAFMRDYIEGR